MKIVFLAPFGIRPKGTVIARMIPLAVELQALGHEVTIIAPPYTNPEDSGKVEVVNGVSLRNVRLGPLRHKVLAAPVLAWRMFRASLHEKPALIHLFKPKGYGGLAAMLILVLRSLGFRLPPVVLDTDDWEGVGGMNELHNYSSVEKRFYSFQESWLIGRAQAVTVASQELRNILLKLGLADNRLLYLPNCVTDRPVTNGSLIRQNLGLDISIPVVLLYTRFFEFEQKKLHWLFGEILQRVPTVKFLVIGRGRRNEEDALKTYAVENGYADALIMAGWVDPVSIADYLAVGDVAIYPMADTLVNRCKCPAKLTELLLAAIPVVADQIGQVPEYMTSELLCDPDDWTTMATLVSELLLDANRRRQLGMRARTYLLNHFSWQTYAVKLDQFYKECLTI